jgi:hypothetical protein
MFEKMRAVLLWLVSARTIAKVCKDLEMSFDNDRIRFLQQMMKNCDGSEKTSTL